MVKFFRKIRQKLFTENKFGKYVLYAIGEIALVVIGILIALSVNNWNEGRKNDEKESLLIKNIIEDLRLDSVHISQSLNELDDQVHTVDDLIAKALDIERTLNYDSIGLIRYSSDFRPISQRNHAEAVSNLENESTREILQSYFLKEDGVADIFIEYEDIVHDKVRPHLSEVGMHNLEFIYNEQAGEIKQGILHSKILEDQLINVKFQQLLFERQLKTGSFKGLLEDLKLDNQELINVLSSNYIH